MAILVTESGEWGGHSEFPSSRWYHLSAGLDSSEISFICSDFPSSPGIISVETLRKTSLLATHPVQLNLFLCNCIQQFTCEIPPGEEATETAQTTEGGK